VRLELLENLIMKTLPVRLLVLLTATVQLVAASFAGETNSSTNREPHFYSKVPWGVGFGMEGTVTNVALVEGRIQFQLRGRFWLAQYPPESTKQVMIEVHRKGGFSATVSPDSFIAMTSDWGAGSVQNDKGRLLKILEKAAERGTMLKFSLTQPKMDFGGEGFALLDAKVWRITDVDLR
jgi:membrane protein implicated in regulation of membrane protease activity